jgi:uncharacterized protein YjbI with pentapeptide repeats
VPGTDRSFTETEYEEGMQHDKSCLVCIRSDEVPVLPKDIEQDSKKAERLKAFIQTLETRHTVYRFRDTAELAVQVIVDLNRALERIEDSASAVRIIRRGSDAWNAWRAAHTHSAVSLIGIDFSGLQLRGINLSGVDLRSAKFLDASLQSARLTDARMMGCVLRNTDLSFAELERVDLTGAQIVNSTFNATSLVAVVLRDCQIINTVLTRADLSLACFGDTVIARSNFVGAIGLDTCIHRSHSSIDIDTLSKGPLDADHFLAGLGVSGRFLAFARSLWAPAFDFYSCFLSYSTKDQEFADRLYADLQAKGIRCWFAPHEIRGGQKIHEQIVGATQE